MLIEKKIFKMIKEAIWQLPNKIKKNFILQIIVNSLKLTKKLL